MAKRRACVRALGASALAWTTCLAAAPSLAAEPDPAKSALEPEQSVPASHGEGQQRPEPPHEESHHVIEITFGDAQVFYE